MSVETIEDSSIDTLRQFVAGRTEPQWLLDVRNAALERFADMRWPSSQDEEFRRSDVSSYDFDSYAFAVGSGSVPESQVPEGQSGSLSFHGAQATSRSLSADLQSKGVVLVSLQEAIAGAVDEGLGQRLKEVLLRGLANTDNRLGVWHYASMTHGAFLYVPRFLEIADPFVVSFEETGNGLLSVPQLLVLTDEGARVTVVHRVQGGQDGEVLVNEALDLHAGDAGEIRYYGLQDVNLDSSYISNGLGTIGRDAAIKAYAAPMGGMFAKYRFDVEMAGRGGDAFVGGVYFPHEDQHIDMRTVQRHVEQNAHSLTLYKGAVTDEAHSVYQGLINVEHEALNTDAYLTNNNLVLGDDAQADSIPTLEIHTDEVRCSHGSTTGKLDQNQIFYLNTRGYSADEARRLLVIGFFEEVIAAYPDVLTEEIHATVEERIGAAEA